MVIVVVVIVVMAVVVVVLEHDVKTTRLALQSTEKIHHQCSRSYSPRGTCIVPRENVVRRTPSSGNRTIYRRYLVIPGVDPEYGFTTDKGAEENRVHLTAVLLQTRCSGWS